jgi:hypothetical protein
MSRSSLPAVSGVCAALVFLDCSLIDERAYNLPLSNPKPQVALPISNKSSFQLCSGFWKNKKQKVNAWKITLASKKKDEGIMHT